MYLFDKAPIENRYNIGRHLMSLGLTDYAVEIGTHRAMFANALLKTWSGYYYGVDPYIVTAYDHLLPFRGPNRLDDRQEAIRVLTKYGSRGTLHIDYSLKVVETINDNSLDFVYIDGSHETDNVTADLNAWYRKIKYGGIIGGHDIVCPGEKNGGWGKLVQNAVIPFSILHNLVIQLVVEKDNSPWSYLMVKK